MGKFKRDQKIAAFYYPDDSQIVFGQNGVEKITVIMEDGQMSGVPWFAVWRDGKIDSKHNAAHIASVTLQPNKRGMVFPQRNLTLKAPERGWGRMQ